MVVHGVGIVLMKFTGHTGRGKQEYYEGLEGVL